MLRVLNLDEIVLFAAAHAYDLLRQLLMHFCLGLDLLSHLFLVIFIMHLHFDMITQIRCESVHSCGDISGSSRVVRQNRASILRSGIPRKLFKLGLIGAWIVRIIAEIDLKDVRFGRTFRADSDKFLGCFACVAVGNVKFDRCWRYLHVELEDPDPINFAIVKHLKWHGALLDNRLQDRC